MVYDVRKLIRNLLNEEPREFLLSEQARVPGLGQDNRGMDIVAIKDIMEQNNLVEGNGLKVAGKMECPRLLQLYNAASLDSWFLVELKEERIKVRDRFQSGAPKIPLAD